MSGNTVWPQAFEKLTKIDHIWNFSLSTQNVNVARFARNVERDFSVIFKHFEAILNLHFFPHIQISILNFLREKSLVLLWSGRIVGMTDVRDFGTCTRVLSSEILVHLLEYSNYCTKYTFTTFALEIGDT